MMFVLTASSNREKQNRFFRFLRDGLYKKKQNTKYKKQKRSSVLFSFLISQTQQQEEDEIYNTYFRPDQIPAAIYTHQWDPTFSSLFVAGGPLMRCLKGCYGGIWQ